MAELAAILGAWDDARAKGARAVLATIVKVSGSTYRRPGARMLIQEDGTAVGLLSGGCLEGDLAERARDVLGGGVPRVVVYDMTSQVDLVWGLGLGCAGTVHVLLEPLPGGPAELALRFLEQRRVRRLPGTMATVIASDDESRYPPGARRVLEPQAEAEGSLGDPALDRRAGEVSSSGAATTLARVMEVPIGSGRVELLVEAPQPPLPLVVFGGGPDAVPLTALARRVDWHVTLVDHREPFARPERFPDADEVILARPEELARRVALGSRTVAVVMTHKFLHDVELLAVLLASPVRYVGLLGPRERARQLRAAVEEKGVSTADWSDRVHGPLGLDIGAETPEEIALAAVAEIRAVVTGRGGGFLRQRVEPLHDPP